MKVATVSRVIRNWLTFLFLALIMWWEMSLATQAHLPPSSHQAQAHIFSDRVRPFVFNPLQCYKYQRIEHTASSCKAKQCCLRCGEQVKDILDITVQLKH